MLSWCCGSMCCVLYESYTVQNRLFLAKVIVTSLRWGGAVAACLVYRVSHILFRMSLYMEVCCATYSAMRRTTHIHSHAHSEQYMTHTRHAATAPTQRNDVNAWVFLNCNFNKEQCMLPEDIYIYTKLLLHRNQWKIYRRLQIVPITNLLQLSL